ncbi:MAG: ribosome biogenesis GTPase Der, partial [Limisphaerales bacterium]
IKAAVEQVKIAIEAADVIIFVVDVRDGVVPLDREVSMRLRKCGRPVLVAVNKVDTSRYDDSADDFAALGFEEMFNVSAIQDRGLDSLMQRALTFLPGEIQRRAPSRGVLLEEETDRIKLAIVGRPNVGKSSIINSLTQSDRVVVSDIPGTTRDAVDVPFEVDTEGRRDKYMLIDTAGLRKKRRVNDTVEFFSTKRTERAIERADVTVFVIDADTGIVEQDKKIADQIVDNHRPCVLVVNKWDLFSQAVEKAHVKEQKRRRSNKREDKDAPEKMASLHEFAAWVQKKLFFLDYAPVIFTSAQSGFNLDRLLEAVRYVTDQLKQKIPTSILNRTIRDAIERKHPIGDKGSFLKFFYATQVKQAPPTFVLFMNKREAFNEAYTKYLGKEMRKAFGFEGCPVVLVTKARPKKVGSIRTVKKPRSKPQSKPGKPPLKTFPKKAAKKSAKPGKKSARDVVSKSAKKSPRKAATKSARKPSKGSKKSR